MSIKDTFKNYLRVTTPKRALRALVNHSKIINVVENYAVLCAEAKLDLDLDSVELYAAVSKLR